MSSLFTVVAEGEYDSATDTFALTRFSPTWLARHRKYDAPVPTNECLHCDGSGQCDDYNECGFCYQEGN